MYIPWQQLSPHALEAVLEDFVTREGTDYGHADWTLAQKTAAVRAQLERREVWLDYDAASGTVTLRRAA